MTKQILASGFVHCGNNCAIVGAVYFSDDFRFEGWAQEGETTPLKNIHPDL